MPKKKTPKTKPDPRVPQEILDDPRAARPDALPGRRGAAQDTGRAGGGTGVVDRGAPAPPEAEGGGPQRPPFSPLSFDDFLSGLDQNALFRLLGGGGRGLGLGGGPSGGGGPSSGGGGPSGGSGGPGGGGRGDGNSGALRQAIQEALLADIRGGAADPTLDPKYDAESERIRAALEEARGVLAELDPETKEQLAQQLETELALTERNFQQQQGQLLARLFGQGIEQSTLAGTVGGQLIGDQQLALGATRAAHTQNVLNTRQFLTENVLQNLGLQSQDLSGARAAALDEMRIQQSERESFRGNLFGLQGVFEQTDASRDVARIGASAQVRSAGIAASATRFAASAAAAATRDAAMARLEGTRYASNAGLLGDLYRTDVGQNQFEADLGFRYYGTDIQAELARERNQTDLEVARIQGQNQLAAIEANQPSMLDRILGFGGAALGAWASSDEELKKDIHTKRGLEIVRKLRGVNFNWKTHGAGRGGGVLAGDVERVKPSAVSRSRSTGFRAVNYLDLVGELVESVKQLDKRTRRMESDAVPAAA